MFGFVRIAASLAQPRLASHHGEMEYYRIPRLPLELIQRLYVSLTPPLGLFLINCENKHTVCGGGNKLLFFLLEGS